MYLQFLNGLHDPSLVREVLHRLETGRERRTFSFSSGRNEIILRTEREKLLNYQEASSLIDSAFWLASMTSMSDEVIDMVREFVSGIEGGVTSSTSLSDRDIEPVLWKMILLRTYKMVDPSVLEPSEEFMRTFLSMTTPEQLFTFTMYYNPLSTRKELLKQVVAAIDFKSILERPDPENWGLSPLISPWFYELIGIATTIINSLRLVTDIDHDFLREHSVRCMQAATRWFAALQLPEQYLQSTYSALVTRFRYLEESLSSQEPTVVRDILRDGIHDWMTLVPHLEESTLSQPEVRRRVLQILSALGRVIFYSNDRELIQRAIEFSIQTLPRYSGDDVQYIFLDTILHLNNFFLLGTPIPESVSGRFPALKERLPSLGDDLSAVVQVTYYYNTYYIGLHYASREGLLDRADFWREMEEMMSCALERFGESIMKSDLVLLYLIQSICLHNEYRTDPNSQEQTLSRISANIMKMLEDDLALSALHNQMAVVIDRLFAMTLLLVREDEERYSGVARSLLEFLGKNAGTGGIQDSLPHGYYHRYVITLDILLNDDPFSHLISWLASERYNTMGLNSKYHIGEFLLSLGLTWHSQRNGPNCPEELYTFLEERFERTVSYWDMSNTDLTDLFPLLLPPDDPFLSSPSSCQDLKELVAWVGSRSLTGELQLSLHQGKLHVDIHGVRPSVVQIRGLTYTILTRVGEQWTTVEEGDLLRLNELGDVTLSTGSFNRSISLSLPALEYDQYELKVTAVTSGQMSESFLIYNNICESSELRRLWSFIKTFIPTPPAKDPELVLTDDVLKVERDLAAAIATPVPPKELGDLQLLAFYDYYNNVIVMRRDQRESTLLHELIHVFQLFTARGIIWFFNSILPPGTKLHSIYRIEWELARPLREGTARLAEMLYGDVSRNLSLDLLAEAIRSHAPHDLEGVLQWMRDLFNDLDKFEVLLQSL